MSHNSDLTTMDSWSGGGTTYTSFPMTDVAQDAILSYTFGNAMSNNQYKGGLYTWAAATAGKGVSSMPENTLVEDSICPKNWKLPLWRSGNKSWGNLYSTLSASEAIAPPYSIIRPGMLYSSGDIAYMGTGFYWSAEKSDSKTYAGAWHVSETESLYQYGHHHWSFSIRCINR